MTKIFYSWQSDLPNATNRGFIGAALERAAKTIREDESIEVEPVIDRDTSGVAGAPDIAATIFGKIDEAAVFVADVSIINSPPDRPTPNPNVLIELGYAKKALGQGRIVMVLNTAFGQPEDLPFDLRPRRVVTYHATREETDRSVARKNLESRLEAELRTILSTPVVPVRQQESPSSLAISAIGANRPDQAPLVRRFMEKLSNDIDQQAPNLALGTVTAAYEELTSALPGTIPVVLDFTRVAEAIATHNSTEAGVAAFRGLVPILDRYEPPPGKGQFYHQEFDFHKFLGHELMTSLFAQFVREERWDLIADVLDNDLALRNAAGARAQSVSFEYAARGVVIFDSANEVLRLGRASLQADLLRKRHSEGELGAALPFDVFMSGDYFLFLRSVLPPTDTPGMPDWDAWSCIFLNQPPRFLIDAARDSYARRLLRPLNLPDVQTFRKRFGERKGLLRMTFPRAQHVPALEDFSASNIGNRR